MKKRFSRFILAMSLFIAAFLLQMTFSVRELAAATTPDYITFTAKTPHSTIALRWVQGINISYRVDEEDHWQEYIKGSEITLELPGDYVQFKGNNIVTDENNHFSMTGMIAASGSVGSLSHGDGDALVLQNGCYSHMFADCYSLTTAPSLPSKYLGEGCYESMFSGCDSLTEAPVLPATELEPFCYAHMFEGCSGISEAPELPATTIEESCYEGMFSGCSSLMEASELPAPEVKLSCYSHMFEGCTKITEAPALPAVNLEEKCYESMFSGCSSLTEVPELPAGEMKRSCYAHMFEGCSSISEAPKLPATELEPLCYAHMFERCGNLLKAPELPADTLEESCYRSMFSGCLSLTEAPVLPATELEIFCYAYMFSGCFSLTEAPELPVKKLKISCYTYMFDNCRSLTTAPALPAEVLETRCYEGMFYECTNLIVAPVLPSTQLASYCYSGMFEGCERLKEAPELPAMILANHCYNRMFSGCSSLIAAPVLPARKLATYCYSYMFSDCLFKEVPQLQAGVDLPDYCYYHMFASCKQIRLRADFNDECGKKWMIDGGGGKIGFASLAGMFFDCPFADIVTPSENVVYYTFGEEPAPRNYLTFTATKDASSITFNWLDGSDVKYRTDETIIFRTYVEGTTISLKLGESVSFKGKNVTTDNENHFTMTGGIAASGSVTSLTDEIGVDVGVELSNYCYESMFRGCSSLETPPELPAYALTPHCYRNMFYKCTNLIEAPKLPADYMADSCYSSMFEGCKKLKKTPDLKGSQLAEYCYYNMFASCENLEEASELNANSLADYCYSNMFYKCKNLKKAPALMVSDLGTGCYKGMFSYCTSLTEIPELYVTYTAPECCSNMFYGCTSLKEVPDLYGGEYAEERCFEAMFSGCSNLQKAPELTYRRMAPSCYQSMFENCTSLKETPELPATQIYPSCYKSMFAGCTGLTTVPELPATFLPDSCYESMFRGCSGITILNDKTDTIAKSWMIPANVTKTDALKDMFLDCPKVECGSIPEVKTTYYIEGRDPGIIITKDLEEVVEAAVGSSLNLIIEAEGEELSYTWYSRKIGEPDFAELDGNEYIYQVTLTENDVDQEIYCVIRDAYGNVKESTHMTLIKLKEDTDEPKITNVEITDCTDEGYTVRCTLSDDQRLNKVTAESRVAYVSGAQTIEESKVFSRTQKEDVTFQINASDHGDRKGLYETRITVYDKAEKNYSIYVLAAVGGKYWTPKNIVQHNGHTYELYHNSLSWNAAKTYCDSLGGHLVCINSPEEQKVIDELIDPEANGWSVCWLGAKSEGQEGNWSWVTGEAMNYSNWAAGEPDDNGDYSYDKDYAFINYDYENNSSWMTDEEEPNWSSPIFICEYDKPLYKDISDCSITLSQSTFTTNGGARKPSVYVKENGVKLTKNKDFTITYSNNVYVGTATVTVKGIGEYVGTLKETYIIRPKGTTLASVTNPNGKNLMIQWNPIYDVDGYEIKYSTQSNFADAKTKRVEGYDSDNLKLSDRTIGKRYYVRVRTYTIVNGETYYSLWSEYKSAYVVPPIDFNYVGNDKAGTINVRWIPSTYNIQGYDIALASDEEFSKIAKKYELSKSQSSLEIPGRTLGKKYYIRIRTFVTDPTGNKIYSQWGESHEVYISY